MPCPELPYHPEMPSLTLLCMHFHVLKSTVHLLSVQHKCYMVRFFPVRTRVWSARLPLNESGYGPYILLNFGLHCLSQRRGIVTDTADNTWTGEAK